MGIISRKDLSTNLEEKLFKSTVEHWRFVYLFIYSLLNNRTAFLPPLSNVQCCLFSWDSFLSLLVRFLDQWLVNVWDDTPSGNGCFDECVQFFIASNGKLQVSGRDTFHFVIFRGVTSKFYDGKNKVRIRINERQNEEANTHRELQLLNTQVWLHCIPQRWRPPFHCLWPSASKTCGYDPLEIEDQHD